MDKSDTAFKAWQDRSISDFQLIRILKEHNEELKKENRIFKGLLAKADSITYTNLK